jgi:Tol biopolymer transport system component
MDDAEGLKETYIGTVFYRRPASYDPRLDSIVRVNMNRLRQRLEEYYATEGQNDRHRIEIPRGSYKPVVVPNAPAKPTELYIVGSSELPVLPPSLLHRLSRPIPLTFLALFIASFVVSTFWLIHRVRVREFQNPSFGVRVMLTSSGDINMDPAISPDGRQMVYASRPTAGGPTHLFLRSYSEEILVGKTLDTGAGSSEHPAWSPDGKQIAFFNCDQDACDIRVLTLANSQVQVVHTLPGEYLTEDMDFLSKQKDRPVWTADGKALIFPLSKTLTAEEQLVRYDLTTHVETQLTHETDSDGVGFETISPDGRTLAFIRAYADHRVLVCMDMVTLSQRVLPTSWNDSTASLTWWPDGKSLVTSSYELGVKGGWYVWRVPLKGQPVKIDLPAVSIPVNPVFAPDGKTLLVLSVIQDRRLVMLDQKEPQRGPVTLFDAHTNRIAAGISPDGKQIAMLRSQDGAFDVWLSTLEQGIPGLARRLTHGLKIHHPQSLQWSPDDRSLAIGLNVQPDRLWVVDVATGKFSRVAAPDLDSKQLRMPQWSRDSRSLFVADGHHCIDEISLGPVPSAQCVVKDNFPDDVRLYGDHEIFYERWYVKGLYRSSLTGDPTPQIVPQLAHVRLSKNWTIAGDGLYYVDLYDTQRRLQRLDLKTGSISTVVQHVPGILFDATVMSYSPQSHVLLYTQMAGSSSSEIVAFPLQ